MKEIGKSITIGGAVLVVLIVILLFIINSNFSVKIYCEDGSGDVLGPCDNAKWTLFQTLWIAISIVISTGIGWWYWKKHKP